MECSCTVYCSFDEPDHEVWELFNKGFYKSSKIQDCDECNRSMEPGEPHDYIFEINQDTEEWLKHRTCRSCVEIRDTFYEDFYYGKLWEELKSSIFDGELQVSETCLVKLSPENRANVCEFIENSWKYIDEDDSNG